MFKIPNSLSRYFIGLPFHDHLESDAFGQWTVRKGDILHVKRVRSNMGLSVSCFFHSDAWNDSEAVLTFSKSPYNRDECFQLSSYRDDVEQETVFSIVFFWRNEIIFDSNQTHDWYRHFSEHLLLLDFISQGNMNPFLKAYINALCSRVLLFPLDSDISPNKPTSSSFLEYL